MEEITNRLNRIRNSTHEVELQESLDKKLEEKMASKAYQQILEILISAGYFRARIADLAAFDKIIGGLCWCLQYCLKHEEEEEEYNPNIKAVNSTDILFHESLSIGEKIVLSENIVHVLQKRMNCNIPLQPHQIQGYDFEVILSVLQWLVNKYFERKEDTEKKCRQYTILQYFDKVFNAEENFSDKEKPSDESTSSRICNTIAFYCPRRQFRRNITGVEEDEHARIQACLLEYGHKSIGRINTTDATTNLKKEITSLSQQIESAAALKVGRFEKDTKSSMMSRFQRKYLIAEQKALLEAQQTVQLEKERQQKFLNELLSIEVGSQNLSSINWESKIEETDKAVKRYQEVHSELQKGWGVMNIKGSKWLGEQSKFLSEKESLKRQVAEKTKKYMELVTSRDNTVKTIRHLEMQIKDREKALQQMFVEEERIKVLEQDESNSVEYQQLKGLILLRENLKSQENDFRISCKQQINEFEKKIKELQDYQHQMEAERYKEIEARHSELMYKYRALQENLVNTSQQIAAITRDIDNIPSRIELIQYERRFVELYEEVAFRLDETRKYYAMYNTLKETHQCIENEVSLIDSINDNFQNAMKNKGAREDYLMQFENILSKLREMVKKQKLILDEKMQVFDSTDSKYQIMLERQRSYFKSIKNFQIACNENDRLHAKLKGQEETKSNKS